MAKVKKRILRWSASESPQVVGYKLYWSEDGQVDYQSKHATLGNVTEIVLPDDVEGFTPGEGSIEFGISAIDELGNESDIVTLAAPYQFRVPQPPSGFQLNQLHNSEKKQTPEEKPALPELIQMFNADGSRN